MRKTPRTILVLALLAIAGLAFGTRAQAYEDWSSCTGCHGSFTSAPYTSRIAGGGTWGGSLHDIHRNNMLNGDCNTCHVSSGRVPTFLNLSNGGSGLAPVGCVGCHDGPGLRQHHRVKGASSCGGCHGSPEAAQAENVARPYYFTPDAAHPNKPTDGCNRTGGENFGGSAAGLDNDGNGLYDTADAACVTVAAPRADAGPAQTVAEGANVTLNGSNSTGTGLTYSWTQTAGPTVTLLTPTAARASFVAPQVAAAGATLTFRLTVTDTARQTASATTTVTVTNVNRPPVADAGPTQTVTAGSPVTLNGSNSSDPDGTIASYAWTQTAGPAVTLSNAATARPSFAAPSLATSTALTFQLTVRDDGGLSATATATVNVSAAANRAPVANAGANQTVSEDATVTLDGSNSSDPDGTIASYAWTQTAGPAVTLSNPAAVKPTFAAPSVGASGAALTFQLTVRDNGGLTAAATTIVNVSNVNLAPVADAGPTQTVSAGTTVTLNGSNSSDPDGLIASYAWRQTAGPAVTLSSTTVAKPTFVAPSAGSTAATLTFQLTVTDDGNLSASATTIVNVGPAPAPQPPVANAGSDQTVGEGTTVTLNGSGTGSIAGYLWAQTGGPAVTLSNPATAKPTFVAPGVDAAGAALTFQLTVKDAAGLSSTDSAIVNVTNVNQPPVARAGSNQTVQPGATVTLDGSASADPDGAIASYVWTQTGGTAVTLSDPQAARPSFTAPTAAGTLTFRLVVTDNENLSSSATVTVTVASVTPAPTPGTLTLTSNLPSPQREGARITFRAATSSTTGYAYRFLLLANGRWRTVRYSTSPTWTWNTDDWDEGAYRVRVEKIAITSSPKIVASKEMPFMLLEDEEHEEDDD